MPPRLKRSLVLRSKLQAKSKMKSASNLLPALFVKASEIAFFEREKPKIESASSTTAASHVAKSISIAKQFLFDGNDQILNRAAEKYELFCKLKAEKKIHTTKDQTQSLIDGNHASSQATVETANLTSSIDMSTWSDNDFDINIFKAKKN